MPEIVPEVHSAPILIDRTDLLQSYTLRNVIIDGTGDVALDISYPAGLSYLWPTVTLENITIRGNWKVGIRLTNCWNATLTNCFITGLVTPETLRWPTMDVGIDCGNSMDVHILNPRVTCAEIGVRVQDLDLDGHGEGFHCHNGWLMNVGTGVQLKGFGSGGWPTPLAHVTNMHIAHNRVGIDAQKYFDLHFTDNNLYGSEYSTFPLGMFAGQCRTLHIKNNTFWQNKNRLEGVAMSFNDCTQLRLRDNVVEPCWQADLVIDPKCSHVAMSENHWDRSRIHDLRR